MDNNLSENIKKAALGIGLCDKWCSEWGNPDEYELLDKYIKGIRFCMQRGFPSLDFIKENVDSQLLINKRIFIEGEHKFVNPSDHTIILRGDCKADIELSMYSVVWVYMGERSCLNIRARGQSKIFVHAYDNARITGACYYPAKVDIGVHGSGVQVNIDGEFSERRVK